MSDEIVSLRCIAYTKSGKRCKNSAIDGSDYCHIHRPAIEQSQRNDAISQLESQEELTDRDRVEQLMIELDNLISRVRAISPNYSPPPSSSGNMEASSAQKVNKSLLEIKARFKERFGGSINEDLFDVETWTGMWYMANHTVEYQKDIAKRRLVGDYETDEWGLDWEFVEAVRPFFDFLYKVYWRVETTGIEHIPDYDRALLVSNHSGQLPWDAAMIMAAVLNEHPAQRLVRSLYSDWFPTIPFISSALVKMGQALASVENGIRLLEEDELVGVFPEGYQGVGKLYKDRYKLARFGRGGFIKMALMTQSPLVPVSVVGAEETYISIAKSPTLARLTGAPYFPLTLRFPWLGVLGVFPIPTKWFIDFGEPLMMDQFNPDSANDLVLISELTDQVRNIIQEMIDSRLANRRSVFY